MISSHRNSDLGYHCCICYSLGCLAYVIHLLWCGMRSTIWVLMYSKEYTIPLILFFIVWHFVSVSLDASSVWLLCYEFIILYVILYLKYIVQFLYVFMKMSFLNSGILPARSDIKNVLIWIKTSRYHLRYWYLDHHSLFNSAFMREISWLVGTYFFSTRHTVCIYQCVSLLSPPSHRALHLSWWVCVDWLCLIWEWKQIPCSESVYFVVWCLIDVFVTLHWNSNYV
jgi:hypothetical protein